MASKGLLSRVMMGGALAAGGALWALAPRLAHERKGLGIREVPDVLYAHRGLHDAGSGLTEAYAAHSGEYVALARRMALQAGYGTADFLGPLAPENSMAAFAAACEAGYGIELDIQLTADGQVAVVHDADLLRVAGDPRRVENLSYEELSRIALFPAPAKPGDSKVRNAAADASAFLDSDDAIADAIGEETAAPQGYYQHVPLFADVLNLVDGRVPLIVEYKFDTMRWDERCTELMEQGDALLRAYAGPYAVESFMPRAMGWYKKNHPEVCRGQLAVEAEFDGSAPRQWASGKLLGDWVSRPDFIAYDWNGGEGLHVQTARVLGATTVSWTIRSQEELERSDEWFDRHIFEAFVPRQ